MRTTFCKVAYKNEDPLQVASSVTPSDRAEESSIKSIYYLNDVVNRN